MNRIKNILKNWKEKHRLSYTNDKTFHVKWSFNVSAINILTLVIFYSILLVISLYLLLVYSPLKKVFFDDVSVYEMTQQLNTNSKMILHLEKELAHQEKYTSNLKNILNEEYVLDTGQTKQIDTLEGIINVEFSSNAADSILRHKIEHESKNISTKKNVSLEIGFFVSPVTGTVSRSLDNKGKHFGVDIVTEEDEPIKAALDGQIIFSGWTNRQGNVIIIQHSNNIITSYKHCSVLLKKEGIYVDAGDPVAIVGNTGELTDGPHLHFEIWHNGVAVNPQEYVSF